MARTNLFNAYHPGAAFRINAPWGMRFHPTKHKWAMHAGQDFPAPMDTPIPAAAYGTVYSIEDIVGYGHCVVLQHTPQDGGPVYYTLYGHLNKVPTLAKGDIVNAGATVGLVGMSGGISTGPHLHFEVIPDQKLPLKGGHATLDPLTFTSWGGLPHMIGTDASGNAIIATTAGDTTIYKAVNSAGELVAGAVASGTGNPSLDTPYDASHPGSQYWVIDTKMQVSRLYDNGVLYTVDKQTKQEFWSVPSGADGWSEVTKFSTGLISTVTYTTDGQIDTSIPGTVSLDDSASADVKAAFDAWVADGNDPSNIYPADLHLDQTAGGISLLLDSRLYNQTGGEYSSNAVLIGESDAAGKGGDMLCGGAGNDLLFGSAGEDVLYGGGGNDFMAGGIGDDTYIIVGPGHFTIEDKIGRNHVIVNGKEIGLFTCKPDGSYISADGKITGRMNGTDLELNDAETDTTLTLNKDFQEGDFGITFKDVPQDPLFATTITGDILPVDTDPTKAGIQAQGDAYGNPAGDAGPYEDILYGSGGNDHIMSGELTDLVVGNGGNDWIEGGTGHLCGRRTQLDLFERIECEAANDSEWRMVA